jgi:hypothetical protein
MTIGTMKCRGETGVHSPSPPKGPQSAMIASFEPQGKEIVIVVKGEASAIIEIAFSSVGCSHYVHYQASGSPLFGNVSDVVVNTMLT